MSGNVKYIISIGPELWVAPVCEYTRHRDYATRFPSLESARKVARKFHVAAIEVHIGEVSDWHIAEVVHGQ